MTQNYLNVKLQYFFMALENIIKCCDTKLEFTHFIGYPPNIIIELEEAFCSICDTYYQKTSGKDFAYKAVEEDEEGMFLYKCTKDDGEIDVSVLNKNSGEYWVFPYCRKHEENPMFNIDSRNLRKIYPEKPMLPLTKTIM